jgi:hypothetical protein
MTERRRPGIDGFHVGDRIRIERDEQLYPSRGTWPNYRGRTGTVVALNYAAREIGVSFEKYIHPREGVQAWFLSRELVPEDGADRPQSRRRPAKT